MYYTQYIQSEAELTHSNCQYKVINLFSCTYDVLS